MGGDVAEVKGILKGGRRRFEGKWAPAGGRGIEGRIGKALVRRTCACFALHAPTSQALSSTEVRILPLQYAQAAAETPHIGWAGNNVYRECMVIGSPSYFRVEDFVEWSVKSFTEACEGPAGGEGMQQKEGTSDGHG